MRLIEKESTDRDHGFSGVNAIIECKKRGRLLIVDGFGGMDSQSGGAVRFRHGMMIKLNAGDTLKGLSESDWNDGTSHMSAVLQGYDGSRPILNLGGDIVEKAARSAGLL